MAVESKTRHILGFRVAKMAAKGLIAEKSRKKYGKRIDERAWKRKSLFKDLRSLVAESALIKSDENPHYLKTVQTYFPKAQHKTYKGRRGCVVGQGELKSGGFDPLFSLNPLLLCSEQTSIDSSEGLGTQQKKLRGWAYISPCMLFFIIID